MKDRTGGSISKNRTVLPMMLFLACLLTACQQAPPEVVEQMENYRENRQAEASDITYCRAEQLREASVDDLEKLPENLVLPKQVDFSGLQDIGILHLRYVENYTEQKEKIAEAFHIDSAKLQKDEQGIRNYEMLMYDDEEKEEYLLICDNGIVSYLGKSCYTVENFTEEESEALYNATKHIYLGTGDTMEEAWTLAGEDISVAQQVEWAEDWLTDSGILSEAFTYPIRTIYLREFPDGKHRISMLAQIRYHGVPLAYAGGKISLDTNIPYMAEIANNITLDMDRPYEIDQCNNDGQYEVTGYEKKDEVIDFPSAVQIVADELSGFQSVPIRKVEIQYVLMPQYDYKSKEDSYGHPGNAVETRPVYCFMIPFGKDYSQRNVAENICYVNVDMLTGEVTSDLEESNYRNDTR